MFSRWRGIKNMKTKGKYKPLPKTNTEKEMLEQIRKELPSDMDKKEKMK